MEENLIPIIKPGLSQIWIRNVGKIEILKFSCSDEFHHFPNFPYLFPNITQIRIGEIWELKGIVSK